MALEQAIQSFLTNPVVVAVWVVLVVASLGVLVWDLRTNNEGTMSLMELVWGFTVLYSGPIGLAVYWYSGRSQIAHDSVWRRGFRSVSHCYSGCGAGEIVGVFIAAGLLSLGNLLVAAVTFALAYVAGFAMTMGPLIQEGEGFNTALKDALYSETPSITIMEIAAVGTDLLLASSAHFTDLLFWSALVFSLSIGLLAAYPVNVLLVHWGVKGGMQDPTQRAQAG
jgi:hypothetical protein